MTYQNIESADIEFVRDSVDRYGKPLVEAFTKWLLPRGTSLVWEYGERMRADQSTTANVLTTYTGAGVMSVDEARAVLGRAPLPEEPEAAAPVPLALEAAPEETEEEEVTDDV